MNKEYLELSPTMVWIADPDRSICWVLEKILNKAGLLTQIFESSDSLVRELNTSKPNLIILDVNSPEMNSKKFLDYIHFNLPDLPIILMTTHSDLNKELFAYDDVFYKYLSKPFDINDVINLVFQACSIKGKKENRREQNQLVETNWQNYLREWVRESLESGQVNLLESALSDLEFILLQETLKYTGGKKEIASKILGWGRNTLSKKAKNFNLG
tara:strand:+ start:635 stop:1276 length:642 start_codon:yes stop_codon:yes gene_type:complete